MSYKNKKNKKNQSNDSLITGDKKVVITGPGRSGTTFLVLLLTRLGFYTGFRPYEEPTDTEWRAGAEFPLKSIEDFDNDEEEYKDFIRNVMPFVIKSPWLSFSLREFLERELMDVGHIIVPVRSIVDATNSRLSVGLSWFNVDMKDAGKDRSDIPFDVEKNMGYAALGSIIETSVMYNIPLTTIRYPDFITDGDYCYAILDYIFNFEQVGIDKDAFLRIFNELKKAKSVKTKTSAKVEEKRRKNMNN